MLSAKLTALTRYGFLATAKPKFTDIGTSNINGIGTDTDTSIGPSPYLKYISGINICVCVCVHVRVCVCLTIDINEAIASYKQFQFLYDTCHNFDGYGLSKKCALDSYQEKTKVML